MYTVKASLVWKWTEVSDNCVLPSNLYILCYQFMSDHTTSHSLHHVQSTVYNATLIILQVIVFPSPSLHHVQSTVYNATHPLILPPTILTAVTTLSKNPLIICTAVYIVLYHHEKSQSEHSVISPAPMIYLSLIQWCNLNHVTFHVYICR